jgi:hypothetical protein
MAVMEQGVQGWGGRGIVTRAMIEAKYGVGLYWEERQNGVGWEVLVHQFEDASVPYCCMLTLFRILFGLMISYFVAGDFKLARYCNQRIQR